MKEYYPYASGSVFMKNTGCSQVDDLPGMLTINELASFLRVSLNTAYTLAKQDGFPAIRMGTDAKSGIRVPKGALLRWLETQVGDIAES
jgi:excisionase family DNA binding protein